jgi:hypothetical protein
MEPIAAGADGFESRLRAAADLKPIGEPFRWPHPATTAYEVYIEHPIANGRIYIRSETGTLVCYDLRRGNE